MMSFCVRVSLSGQTALLGLSTRFHVMPFYLQPLSTATNWLQIVFKASQASFLWKYISTMVTCTPTKKGHIWGMYNVGQSFTKLQIFENRSKFGLEELSKISPNKVLIPTFISKHQKLVVQGLWAQFWSSLRSLLINSLTKAVPQSSGGWLVVCSLVSVAHQINCSCSNKLFSWPWCSG